MAVLTIRDVSRRSGLNEPTLRYYEEIGLIGPIARHEGSGTELVVVNPTFILGPTLTTELGSSLQLVKAMLDGTMTVVRRQRFGVADVRDVADLHIRAMAAPGAAD